MNVKMIEKSVVYLTTLCERSNATDGEMIKYILYASLDGIRNASGFEEYQKSKSYTLGMYTALEELLKRLEVESYFTLNEF